MSKKQMVITDPWLLNLFDNPLENYIDNSLTDKNSRHSYLNIYNTLFEPFKNKHNNLLEIGVSRGGSILLWHKWFINSKIFCIDIIQEPIILSNLDRVKYLKSNAYSDECVEKIPNLDIAIDDGPHTLESQLYFIDRYGSKINSGGLLIIEDVCSIKRYNILSQKINNKFTLEPPYIGNKIHKAKDDMLLIARAK